MQLHLNNRIFSIDRPLIMGILNATPDSFSDGGQFNHLDAAVDRAMAMVEQGADVIDIGGESTRPGAADVSAQDELERVVPVIEKIRNQSDVMISVDTSKASVMKAACAAGADIINDVRALREPGALEVAANSGAAVCLMHMLGQPRTMQNNPQYDDVVKDVIEFLQQRVAACNEAGIASEKIILDPGFGFGKTMEHNFELLGQTKRFVELGHPVLIGVSRKSMFGNLLERPVDERLAASLAAASFATMQGAHILRVHDVQETFDTVKVLKASMGELNNG